MKTLSRTFSYSLKVWLTTAFIAPLIYLILLYFHEAKEMEIIILYPFFISFGLLFSIPCFIGLFLGTLIVLNLHPGLIPKKAMTTLISLVLLGVLTFYFNDMWLLLIPYYFVLIASCLFIRLE